MPPTNDLFPDTKIKDLTVSGKLCACGCGQMIFYKTKTYLPGHRKELLKKVPFKLCACGCGKHIPGKRKTYYEGHRKAIVLHSALCACGCGKMANPGRKYITHHQRKGQSPPLSVRLQISRNLKGKICIPREVRTCACGCGLTFGCKINSNAKYIAGHSNKRRMKEVHCQICNRTILLGGLAIHLNSHNISNKEYYDKYIKKEKEGVCGFCGKETKYGNFSYNKFCGCVCASKVITKSESRNKKIGNSCRGEKNGMFGKHPSIEAKDKMSIAKTNSILKGNFNYIKGHFFSQKNNKNLHYRSSYELLAYQILEGLSKVVKYEVETVVIPYKYKDSIHRYIVDVKVLYDDGHMDLIEVKASFKLKYEQTRLKLEAGRQYAKENNMNFLLWTEKELGKLKGDNQ